MELEQFAEPSLDIFLGYEAHGTVNHLSVLEIDEGRYAHHTVLARNLLTVIHVAFCNGYLSFIFVRNLFHCR